jgi:hypothetical protein
MIEARKLEQTLNEKRIRDSRFQSCSPSVDRAAPKAFGVDSGFESRPTHERCTRVSLRRARARPTLIRVHSCRFVIKAASISRSEFFGRSN